MTFPQLNDDAAGLGLGCFGAELVFLLRLAFADAGHTRLMEIVDQKRFDFALVSAPEFDVFQISHGVAPRHDSG
jgi:hypothetical protein